MLRYYRRELRIGFEHIKEELITLLSRVPREYLEAYKEVKRKRALELADVKRAGLIFHVFNTALKRIISLRDVKEDVKVDVFLKLIDAGAKLVSLSDFEEGTLKFHVYYGPKASVTTPAGS